MEEEGVIIFREQKVSVFRLPTVVISQGHYLDSWKDKIWVGELQVVTNKDFLTVKLVDQNTGKLYGQSPMNSQYQQSVQKCVDSSRGYALKLIGDNDRFAWVGIGFHDRVSAFQFFSTFTDYQKILNQKGQKYEIQKKDFTLKQNQKIRINTGNNEIIEQQAKNEDFDDDDFQLNIKSKKKPKPKIDIMNNDTNFI